MMRTYAIRLKAPTIVDGVEYPADFQIGALTTEAGPLTLLGLVQFQHAAVEEITDAVDAEESEAEQEESTDGDTPADDPTDGPADLPLVDDTSEAEADPQPEKVPTDNPPAPADTAGPVAAFVAAGLDIKTAEALVESNGITSVEELRLLMADPEFDMIDLDEVGTVRAEKIRAAFPAE